MFFLPRPELAHLVLGYARKVALFDESRQPSDLSFRLSLDWLRERHQPDLRLLIGQLSALSFASGLFAEPRPELSRGVLLLQLVEALASQWDLLELDLALGDGGVELRGSLVPAPGSRTAGWLARPLALPDQALPALRGNLAVRLEWGADGSGIVQELFSAGALGDDPELGRLLATARGEWGLGLAGSADGPAVLLVTASERDDAAVDRSGSVEGEVSGLPWRGRRIGNWSLIGFGRGGASWLDAAVDQIGSPPAIDRDDNQSEPSPSVARLSLSVARIVELLGGRQVGVGSGRKGGVSNGGEGAGPAALTVRGLADGGALRLEGSFPVETLVHCVPVLDLR